MGFFLRNLARAVLAGVGWKIGTDAYDAIKKRFTGEAAEREEEGEELAAEVANEER